MNAASHSRVVSAGLGLAHRPESEKALSAKVGTTRTSNATRFRLRGRSAQVQNLNVNRSWVHMADQHSINSQASTSASRTRIGRALPSKYSRPRVRKVER